MRLVCYLLVLFAAPAAAQKDPLAPRFADSDTDGDGLSDFQEVHKYRTDPANPDTDGDGVPDGDWDERREFTYTVRTRVRVVPPVDVSAVDDYQDARVLAEGDGWVEIEAIHYPLGTAHEAIVGDPAWRKGVAAWKRYLESTTTSRWNAKMRRTLLAELEGQGVDVEGADDRTLAVAAARRLMERSTFADGFTTFLADFQRGRPVVPRELKEAVRRREQESGRSVEEQWERELLADGMFEHRVHGSCTSSAIYLCGGLRAAGIPTRIVLSIPLVDANDPEQLAMVEEGIRHHRVRAIALEGLRKLEGSWASHTFNEVMVGGRWRRLNYARLGQPILDPGLYGLTTHVLTVRDWADARMGLTVGRRQELGLTDELFPTRNPYRALEVDDLFGEHADVENPPYDPDAPPAEIELAQAFWAASPERPAHLGLSGVDLATDRVHVFAAARVQGLTIERAHLDGFWSGVAKRVELVSSAGQRVEAQAIRGFWFGSDDAGPYLYYVLRIDDADRARMTPGERYALVPSSPDSGPRFVAVEGLAITVPSETPLERVELERAFWAASPERPAYLKLSGVDLATDRVHVFAAARVDGLTLERAGLVEFWTAVEKRFELVSAAGQRIAAQAIGGFWFGSDDAGPYLYYVLRVDDADRARMTPGERYAIVPVPPKSGARFVAAESLTVVVPN